MKKLIIILSAITLMAGNCGQVTKKQADTANSEVAIEQNDEIVEQNFKNNATYSPFLITDYQPYSNTIHTDSILFINETCLIEVWPDRPEFDDEDSEEAQEYYESMDDWYWYIAETRERFEKMGIKSVVAKRYLSFTLSNGEKIIVDTKKEQNGELVSALLYKQGHIPMLVYIDNHNMEIIEDYLQK